jgi:HD superfamily phosphohydrolase
MLGSFARKRVSDVIHGPIGLSELELDLIQSPAYQRLRGIKQLGLAHYVYPSADYSRFSHSLGVCHVTGQILASLCDVGVKIPVEEIQLYRLAALFHDVGHYPFSHATEIAIQNHYSAQLYRPSNQSALDFGLTGDEPLPEKYFMHERVGKEVITQDPTIRARLSKAGIDPKSIYSIFLRENPPRFSNLISSDLDADRIDYLLRTAHHTGLPYGHVDIAYLMSQMRVDPQNQICVTAKALQTAEHLLLCRYFDYRRSNYHKTVAAFELVLKDIIEELLKADILEASAPWVSGRIRNETWATFDDAEIMRLILKLSETTADVVVRQKALSILNRQSPKLICEMEYFADRDNDHKRTFRLQRKAIKDVIDDVADRFGIAKSLWYSWEQAGMPLTKVGPNVPVSTVYADEELDPDRYQQLIRILDPDGKGSKPIVEVRHSLMSVLSAQAWYSLRLFVLLPPAKAHLRDDIRAYVVKQYSDLPWT